MKRTLLSSAPGFTALAIVACSPAAHAGVSCETLAGLKVANTVLTAEPVAAGEFHLQGLGASAFASLPAFCRVVGHAKPSADSDVLFEVWLPAANWNERFLGVGNGGLAGAIGYSGLNEGLAGGYAVASTDTGHTGTGASGEWALGHPEKVIDFGHRAVHVMTLAAKEIAAAYYGAQIQHSYWNGCSEGGNQGLGEAQRYPADYDGIVAGAPASDFTHLQMGGLWISHAIHKDPASFIAGPQLATLNRAVLAACDANDGVRDGIVADPTRCTFDPKSLQCKGGATDDCLTRAQIEGIRKIYEGAQNPRTHQSIFPGYQRGGELGWESWIAGTNVPPVNRQHLIQNAFFTYIAFENAEWDWTGFDFDGHAAEVDRKLAATVNNTDPDLTAFKKRGGKLLQYHGWYDPAISPLASVRYFERVEGSIGDPREFYRLFMVPGMGHCGGGPGADQFDKLSVLKAWVEEGKAPDSIVAARSDSAKPRTRLLCPYPQVAMWTREGDSESAEQYRCVSK